MFGCVKTLLLFYQTNFRVNIDAEFLADEKPARHPKERQYPLPWQPPEFTSTNACRPCTAAGPSALPFQPHRSIIQAASIFTRPASTSSWGMSGYSRCKDSNCRRGTMGFIKKLPALPSAAQDQATCFDGCI